MRDRLQVILSINLWIYHLLNSNYSPLKEREPEGNRMGKVNRFHLCGRSFKQTYCKFCSVQRFNSLGLDPRPNASSK